LFDTLKFNLKFYSSYFTAVTSARQSLK